jgi:hypothetical protein
MANLGMLMEQCHWYGSFLGDNTLTALSYGGPALIYPNFWWCTISGLDPDKIEDMVKVNCRLALEYSRSGYPVTLACSFADINARNTADDLLSRIGFHASDTPHHFKKASHIVYAADFY